jgi:hypothetical protein
MFSVWLRLSGSRSKRASHLRRRSPCPLWSWPPPNLRRLSSPPLRTGKQCRKQSKLHASYKRLFQRADGAADSAATVLSRL